VKVCESGRSVCKVAKGDQLGWAGVLLVGRLLAWRGAGTHVWRRGRLSLALLRGGAKEGD
jgi:hypothetical protein